MVVLFIKKGDLMNEKRQEKAKKKVVKQEEKRNKGQMLNMMKVIRQWAKDNAAEQGLKVSINSKYIKKDSTKGQKKSKKLTIIEGQTVYSRSPTRIETEAKIISRNTETFVNCADTDEKIKFKLDARVLERKVHTFLYGLNLGVFAGVTTPYGGGGLGLGANFQFNSENTKEEEQTVSKEIEITVMQQHEAVIRGEMWTLPIIDEFTIDLTLSGDIPLNFNEKVKYEDGKFTKDKNGKKPHFIPVHEIFQSLQEAGKLPEELSFRIEGDKVVCTLKGKYRTYDYKSEVVTEKTKALDLKSIVPAKSQSEIKGTHSPQLYEYAPGVDVTGEDFQTTAEELMEFPDEQFVTVLDVIMSPADEVPKTILKLAKNTFLKIHEDRPLPDQNVDRPVKVAHQLSITGKRITLGDLVNKKGLSNTSTKVAPGSNNALHELIANALGKHYQFKLHRPSVERLEISLKKSGEKSEKTALTLENLKKSLTAYLVKKKIENIQISELDSGEDAIKLEGEVKSINQLVVCLRKETQKAIPGKYSFFTESALMKANDSDEIPEDKITCKVQ